MLSLGSLSFLLPWALAALVVLPALWWLLRITPPTPSRRPFPPVRLLFKLSSREQTSAKSPLWLTLLRQILAIVLIVGAAHPVLNAQVGLMGQGPLILVIDDDWAAARDWPGRRAMLTGLIDQAAREKKPVIVVTTTPPPAGASARPVQLMRADEAKGLLESLQPKPWPSNRVAALSALVRPGGRLARLVKRPGQVVWLSDGLAGDGADELAQSLRRFGDVTIVSDRPERQATVLLTPSAAGADLMLRAARPDATGDVQRWVRAIAEDGRVLARTRLNFAAGSRKAEARLALPAELRNRLARLELEDEGTAAAVVLVDERWRRRPVGLVDHKGTLSDQPLLSALYYLERALAPFTEVRRAPIDRLLRRELAVLVLADPGPLDLADQDRLADWIQQGGVLLRFAGPRLAQGEDSLLPVKLRGGDRALGGSMSWAKPARLAPFEKTSPFFGLAIPPDVKVRRQVLAQPSLDLAGKTWARLEDGTPLVTAERRGKGWLVLVHTTASAQWSDLPFSGLFVAMLRRVVELGRGVVAKPGGPPLPPLELLDGFGRLAVAPAAALSIPADDFARTVVGPDHPPGYYGRAKARRALNLSPSLPAPRLLRPSGVARTIYGAAREVDLRAWLLGLALLLALIELAASLALRGLLHRRRVAAAGVLAVAIMVPGGPRAATPDDFALKASLETRLAYVITGNAEADEVSREGLEGLSTIVRRRTAAELGEPMGVDPEKNELVFFPLLYWPVTPDQPALSARAVARLNAYLLSGGTILFDTRDRAVGAPAGDLATLTRGLDVPPLVPVPAGHVLTKSFYLLRDFPGRFSGGTVWVERAGERVNDGVSSVIVGGNDWAAAWAMDDAQRPMFAVVPGGPRQREMAFRFGINLVMYTLTGNYKADQVHVPAILKRLGQ